MGATSTIIEAMTAKERLHKLVDELSEAEADETLRFAAARRHGNLTDEWGNLDAWSDAASSDTMRMLDEEENSVGFSWEQRDSI
ncbi:MAG: hypothetical protein ACRDK4_07715 [Solirubrobacteraceae bacterium]